jgi:hypothetical protein
MQFCLQLCAGGSCDGWQNKYKFGNLRSYMYTAVHVNSNCGLWRIIRIMQGYRTRVLLILNLVTCIMDHDGMY